MGVFRNFMAVVLAGSSFLSVMSASATTQTNEAAFFRMVSPSNVMITDFDVVAGTISWSNGVTGVTNQLQRSADLTASNGWTDYVMLVSTGATEGTEHIIDLYPPERMVLIPGGMNCGTNPLAPRESYDETYPSNYCLSVSAFYMDATEVTKAHWDAVYNWATNNSYHFYHTGQGKASDHPVRTVSWFDCVKWCNARSEMEGLMPCYMVGTNVYLRGQSEAVECNLNANGYRLPTSDEWEYAARGGLKNKRFGWGDTITHSNANYNFHPNYDDGTSPVGSFAANGYGLFDMSGNVTEWCFDWFPGLEGWCRVFRSGSWRDTAGDCRTGYRLYTYPESALDFIGFRTVRNAD